MTRKNRPSSIVLGIETTCDETAAALVFEGRDVLSHVVASSAALHEQYGGVFPEVACRRHAEVILPVIEETLQKGGVLPEEIEAIAVAKGPGLVGALLIGLQAAKGLCMAWDKPLIGVNHVEAHLYAAFMSSSAPPIFPSLGLVLSGGHTFLVRLKGIRDFDLISSTVDDAIGEAFDKVASLLGLPYPGGPHVEALAKKGDPFRFPFRGGMVKKNPLDFSFSGLKTSVLYAVREQSSLSSQDKADIAASFQRAAFSDLIQKTKKSLNGELALYFGGGVSNNRELRAQFGSAFADFPLFWPRPELTLDNAMMIAGLGYHQFLENPLGDPLDLRAEARIAINSSSRI